MGTMTLTELGSRVRTSRHARRLTVKQLAQGAGIADNTLSRIEQGGRVRPGNLQAVLTALDIELSHEELQAVTRGEAMSAPAPSEVEELRARVAELERKVDLLTRGLHLTLAGVRPGLEWLDAWMGGPNGDAAQA